MNDIFLLLFSSKSFISADISSSAINLRHLFTHFPALIHRHGAKATPSATLRSPQPPTPPSLAPPPSAIPAPPSPVPQHVVIIPISVSTVIKPPSDPALTPSIVSATSIRLASGTTTTALTTLPSSLGIESPATPQSKLSKNQMRKLFVLLRRRMLGTVWRSIIRCR